ncbi:hypothetical protein D3C76_1780790 [compost metagenome]
MIDIVRANRLAVELQLNLRRVAAHAYINDLTRAEIPVREQVNHRTFLIIRPSRLVDVIGVFRERCCIQLSKI